ncbi:nucleotidyltransferase domain-containing protein [Actinomadura graeca]|uniref:Nucleotidyltransferase domain-containing protein n=1 Tax=Actinomadura graeca TaxID=2750812 RepID=A0ABX8QTN4_9ACTN|nr:nucleotidyltransferase domain-containing protein [Actinomadura graeca]QXJ21112.1 nucleotidyltransferase domain-containing protein [Actinomadura graeca]
MVLAREQLEEWSERGDFLQAAHTYETIKEALTSAALEDCEYEIFCQGSYAGKTNIVGDSDVDVVIALKDPFYANTDRLPPVQKEKYLKLHESSTRTWEWFRGRVIPVLQERFFGVQVRNKCVEVPAKALALKADVLISLDFHLYTLFHDHLHRYFEGGIEFHNGRTRVVNYPMQHRHNGEIKDLLCGGVFKPVVRIAKNARNRLVEDERSSVVKKGAPSYFVECLFYNVPNLCYIGCREPDAYRNAVVWLWENPMSRSDMLCQNRMTSLFGGTAETSWNLDDARLLVNGLYVQLTDHDGPGGMA